MKGFDRRSPRARGSWSLVVLTSLLVLSDSTFVWALGPLVPALVDDYQLSSSQVGNLVAAYLVGGMIVTLPAITLMRRRGVREASLWGLLVSAAACAAFGFADQYGTLFAARLVHGAGALAVFMAAMAWVVESSDRLNRGRLIGLVLGVSGMGAVFGPAIGGLVLVVGRPIAFLVASFYLLALAGATSLFPDQPIRYPGKLRTAFSARAVRASLYMVIAPSGLMGALMSISPLHLSAAGAGGATIAGSFIVAAIVGIPARPMFGRWSDRRGRYPAISGGLLVFGLCAAAFGLADSTWAAFVTAALAVATLGLVWAPSFALVADACEDIRAGQIEASAITALAWGAPAVLGASGAGFLAEVIGTQRAMMCIAAFAASSAVAVKVAARSDGGQAISGAAGSTGTT